MDRQSRPRSPRIGLLLVVGLAGLLLALPSGPLSAQTMEAGDYERVLLPVLLDSVAGDFGSTWSSTFNVYNGGVLPARTFPASCLIDPFDHTPCSATFDLPSRVSGQLLKRRFFGDPPGLFFYVKKDAAPNVHFNLRVQDLSRQADTLGTEIPVIRERDLITQTISLVNVPVGSSFRDTLRVYDFDASGAATVTVTAFEADGKFIGSVDLRLVTPTTSVFARDPGYAEISSVVGTFPTTGSSVVLEIKPTSGGLRYWAFVSVTNNVTQDVTTVTPH